MKRPSLQFYPADWRNNAKLRRSSFADRGLWIDIICLMHDSDEYGVLRWSLEELANAIGCRVRDLQVLASRGIMKGADVGAICQAYVHAPRHAGKEGEPVTLIPEQPGPVWYSSRMVLDEWLRGRRGASTRFTSGGTNPKSYPQKPTARHGETPSRTPTARHGATADDNVTRSPTRRQGHGATSSSSSKDLAVPKSETGGPNGRQVKGMESLQVTPPDPPNVERARRIAEAVAMGNNELAQQIREGLV